MRRRDFLGVSAGAAVGLIAGGKRASAAAESPTARQFFELRRYHFAGAEKQKAYEQFLADAGVAAYNRAGVEPVGVWKILAKDNPKLKLTEDSTDLYVFLPHNSMESVLALESRLSADEKLQADAKSILNATTKGNYSFERYESMLLQAMEGAARVEITTKSPERVFELRTYESPTAERAINKLAMFNKGEFAFFKQAGMPGVFFGGAIAGRYMPQLTYMVAHERIADQKANWDKFNNVPGWRALRGQPQWKANVSNIIDEFVRPSAASQI